MGHEKGGNAAGVIVWCTYERTLAVVSSRIREL